MSTFTMPSHIVFESTESVIEILWDIALAIFITRLAFIYVVVTAVAVALFAWATTGLLPLSVHLPEALSKAVAACSSSGSASDGAEHALTFVALALPAVAIPALCARFINGYFRIPRMAGYRLSIGAMALVYIGLGGLLASLVLPAHMRHAGHCEGAPVLDDTCSHSLRQLHLVRRGLFLASVGLMPCLSMWLMEGVPRSRRTTPTPSTPSELSLPSSEKRDNSATVAHAAYAYVPPSSCHLAVPTARN